MKKIFGVVLALVLLFGALLIPSKALAADTLNEKDVEDVSSFELFWPIVAGKTSGDSLYWLKTLKENLRESLIFSKYKKTDYDILMAEKRVVEFENLVVVKKDYVNASKTLEMSKAKRSSVQLLLKELEGEGTNTKDLKNRFTSSLENQKKLIISIQSKVPDQAASEVLKNFLSSLNSDLSNLK